MSDFRIFCIGALIGNTLVGVVSLFVGPPSSLLVSLYAMAISGTAIVTVAGGKSA